MSKKQRMIEVKELFQQGYNVTEIAQILGVTRRTIYNYFEEMGEEVRERLALDPAVDLEKDLRLLDRDISRLEEKIDGCNNDELRSKLMDVKRRIVKDKQELKGRFGILREDPQRHEVKQISKKEILALIHKEKELLLEGE